MSSLLLESGYEPTCCSPAGITSPAMDQLPRLVKEGKFSVIWIDVPSLNAVPFRRDAKTARRIQNLMENAASAGVPAFMSGVRGRAWVKDPYQLLCSRPDIFEADLQLCRYNVTATPQTGKPAGTTWHLCSTVRVEHMPCQCPTGTVHELGWHDERSEHRASGGSTRRRIATQLLYCQLLQQVVFPRTGHPPSKPDSHRINNVHPQPSWDEDAAPAYPTEAAERAKQLKASGHVPVKRKKKVEEHYDDIGDDLSGLGDVPMIEALAMDTVAEPPPTLPPGARLAEAATSGLTTWWFTEHISPLAFQASSFEEFAAVSRTAGHGLVMCELCGGEARTTRVASRLHLATGANFDLVTQVDLGRPVMQQMVLAYLDEHQVLVAVMAPSCRSLGPPSNLNYRINYDTWKEHFDEDRPHVSFCGKVALHQMRAGRHFFAEQPYPSWLFQVEPWPSVLKQPGYSEEVFDQCRCGQKGANNLPVKKPTVAFASTHLLTHAFQNLRCKGDHKHDTTWGVGTRKLQVWPWGLAERVVQGITLLLQAVQTYPSMASGPGESEHPEARGSRDPAPPPAAPATPKRKFPNCPGCVGKHSRYDPRHTRIPGQCAIPPGDVAPWTCPGCTRNPPRPRGHSEHTQVPGECRWFDEPHKAMGERRTGQREQFPREPRRPAAHDPNAGLPGSALNPDTEGMPPEQGPVGDVPDTHAPGAPAVPARQQGPRAAPRAQPQVVDRAVGDNPEDWTAFDVTQSLRMLRTGTDAQIRREIRKLHLRWWHATRTQMERVLRAAGCPSSVTEKVADVVDTCRECRAWQAHGPQPTPSVELATKQDEEVEGDILFYKQFPIWHMIDRADRWHSAELLAESIDEPGYKSCARLCAAIQRCWLQTFGPFKYFIVDGESGLMSSEAKPFFERNGITVRPRAPQQHARMIERRGAVLRHSMHTAEEQMAREGLPITMTALLAECVFAGNALTSYAGVTPYNARFGKQPSILPDLLALPDDTAGPGRNIHRIREIAVQKIVEATATARINRTLGTRVTPSGEALDYKKGELVDFYRPPDSKDRPGWRGPAVVAESLPGRGQVRLTWNGRDLLCRFADVRRFMDFTGLVYGTVDDTRSASHAPWRTVVDHISSMKPGSQLRLGLAEFCDGRQGTSATSSRLRALTLAVEHVVRNVFQLVNVLAVRIGNGVQKFKPSTGISGSLLIWWRRDARQTHTYEQPGAELTTADIAGPEWQHQHYIQVLFAPPGSQRLMSDLLGADELQPADLPEPRAPVASTPNTDSAGPASPTDDRLSTIPEGSNESADTPPEVDEAWWASLTEQQQTVMTEVFEAEYCPRDEMHEQNPLPCAPPPLPVDSDPVVVNFHYTSVGAEPLSAADAIERDEQGNAYVEMLCPGDAAKLVMDAPVPDGYCGRLRVYVAGPKKAVIDRDTDLLTADEYRQHAKEVAAAVLEEFKVWIEHDCFERCPRLQARNILDCRWVGKWKWVKQKADPTQKVRIVRMRLTLRGFKDADADQLATYAGTSARLSQRLIVSEAVCRGWTLTALDVKKAFLKGISYRELAEATQEPQREVCVELSPDAVAILRQCPGFTDFDETREVLRMTKPGTGCKDAPKCWSMKLASATNTAFGASGTTYDPELICRHNKAGELEFIATKHVDDLKCAGSDAAQKSFEDTLEDMFGKGELDITRTNFTCCGVRHTHTPEGGYELDQRDYIAALKPIGSALMTGISNDTTAPAEVARLFLSLLMALAFTLLTRVDLHVYVVALQRHAQTPTCGHVRKLNTLVKWAQLNPLSLVYKPMTCLRQLEVHSDGAFRKEEKEGQAAGRAMRGAVYLRLGKGPDKAQPCHLLDWQCGTLKTVTRSTFTSEMMSAIGAADHALALALAMHEIVTGPVSTTEACRLRDGESSYAFRQTLCIDSMGLLTAVTAARPKPPAEQSLYPHVLWLRELLCSGVMGSLMWEDTRDMVADALTKGSIARDALREVAQGTRTRAHPPVEISLNAHGTSTLIRGREPVAPAEEAE